MQKVVKQCFKCGQSKPLSAFYKHPAMTDGYLGKCKECAKVDVRANRRKRIDYYRAYDRKRGARRTAEDVRRYRKANPKAQKAHRKVAYAISSQKLTRQPCEVCGREDTHAHHDDYSKPLDVRWLCPPCHFAHHKSEDL